MDCKICGYLQFVDPTWLDTAYSNPINVEDVGIVQRNTKFLKMILSLAITKVFAIKSLLDLGGGTGLLVRMLRDAGINAYWDDPYCENIFAREFSLKDFDHSRFSLTCAFEVFEHLLYPTDEVKRALDLSDVLVFSTELWRDSGEVSDWWYLGLSHGQHIGFYREQTIEYLAKIHSCHFYTNGTNFHILSKHKLDQRKINISLKLQKYLFLLRRLFFTSKTWTDYQKIVTRQ